METWLLSFTAGLLGSLHCVGMCGGIVCAYSLSLRKSGCAPAAGIVAQLLYNVGRLFTYTLLGAAAGFLGHATTGFGQWQAAGRVLAVGAGVAMVVMGLGYAGLFPKLLSFEGAVSGDGSGGPFKRLAALMAKPLPALGLPIGLGMGLLPCGLVYAMLAGAAGTASAVEGGLTMLAFGLGTFPALLVTGITFHRLSERFRKNAMKAAAVAFILAGVFTIWRGFAPRHDHAGHIHQPEQPGLHEHSPSNEHHHTP